MCCMWLVRKILPAVPAVTAVLIFSPLTISAQETGWFLQQKSSHTGEQQLYVTATGIKTYSPKNKVGVFSRGPGWQVFMYNDQTKLYFDEPINQWIADLSKNKSQLEGATWKAGRQANIAGLKATEYVMSSSPPPGATRPKKRTQATPRAASFWVANEISIPRNLVGLMAKTYGLPSTYKVPLAFTVIGADGRTNTLLQTVSVQKVTMPPSLWLKPTGYKRAKSDVDVLVDQDTKDAIDDLIKEL